MAKKPTYEELEQRVKELESKAAEKKAVEERLAACSAYLENTLASAPDGVLLLDEQERFSYVNPAFLNWLGREAEDFLGKTLQEVSPPVMSPETTAIIAERAKRRVKTGEPIVGAEVEIIDKDGKPMPVAYSAAGIRDEKGYITGEVVFIRDITERRRVEEQIRMLSCAVKQSIDGIAIGDLEPKLTYVNDAFARMHGYSPHEMLGMKVTQLHSAEQMGAVRRGIHDIRTHGSWHGEIGHIRKDGTPFPTYMSVTLLRDEKGGPTGILAVCRDITDRKQAEQELRESEEKYRRLFEDANDAIFLTDTDTHIILDANRQAERLIGRPRKEIIGMQQSELHPPEHAEYYEEKLRKYVQRGRVLDLQAEVIRKDGGIVPVFISASVIGIQGKQVTQGIFRDATEERRVLNLAEEITTKHAIDKAKRLLMDRHGISDKEAMSRLQKESRRQRRKVKETAQAVTSSDLILN
jgi:PAS domain S-box-containing protein